MTYRKAIPPRAQLRSTEQLPGGAIEPGTLCDTLFAEQCPQLHLEKMHQTQMVERHRAGLGCHARSVACGCGSAGPGRGGGGPRVENNGPMALWRRQLHVVVVIAQPPARLWISKGGAPAFLLHQPPGIDRSKMDVGLEDAAQLATEYEQLHGENETPVGELSS